MTLTVVLTGPKPKDRNTSKPINDMEPLSGKTLFTFVAVGRNIAVVGQLMGNIIYKYEPHFAKSHRPTFRRRLMSKPGESNGPFPTL